jgi:pimeloyl-ACP methyl ester carboxylesterase
MKLYKSEAGAKAIHDSYDRLVKMWGIETEERDLEGSYGRTHAILAGSLANPPLLMFHGVGDDSALMWVKNAKELSKRFRLIAIDTMGGPGKSLPDGRYGKDFRLAQWYGDILDALGLNETYAAGVSYGAYHCQLLMISYPERVKKIVGISGFVAATGYGGSRFGAIFRLMKFFLPAALIPTIKNALRIGAKIMGPDAENLLADSEIAEHFWLLMKHYRAQAQFNHSRRTFSPEELASIRDKSLFLVGDADILVNSPGASKVMDDLKMNYKMIKDAGHAANHTKPREIEAEIVGFCLGG